MVNYLLDGSVALSSLSFEISAAAFRIYMRENLHSRCLYTLTYRGREWVVYTRCTQIEFNSNYSALYLYGIGSYMQEFVNKGQKFKH